MEATAKLYAIQSCAQRAEAADSAAPPEPTGRHCVRCQNCNMRHICLPAGLTPHELQQLEGIVHRKRPVKRGEYLYRAGDTLQSLYAVRSGFLKSCILHDDGREQVTAFHMMGELLGVDAIGARKHFCDAVAIEDAEICEIPFAELESLTRSIPTLQQHFHKVMSSEITRDYGMMLLLGSMCAEERLAAFLLNLSQRFAARGYSGTRFHLRMTRQEIGSYLGMKLETISRTFSRLQSSALIAVENKNIELKDLPHLRKLVQQGAGDRFAPSSLAFFRQMLRHGGAAGVLRRKT